MQGLLNTIKQFYGDRLFTHHGVTYPVIVFPQAAANIEQVLTNDVPQLVVDAQTFAFYDNDHLNKLKQDGRNLSNDLCYITDMLHLHPMQLSARLGHYFDMLATCDALDHEMRDFAQGLREHMPHREQLASTIAYDDSVLDGRGRCAVLGVAVVTLFQYDGDYRVILAKRSKSVATGAGLYHVVPAFVFQPTGPPAFYAVEWSIKHQVLREWGEELFGMPEFSDWEPQPQFADYFYTEQPVKDLRTMLDDGRAELFLTGVAFNPLSTRIELTVLLMIHDDGWFLRSEATLEQSLFTERQKTHYVPLSVVDDFVLDDVVPQGAAALWLGVDKARAILALRRAGKNE